MRMSHAGQALLGGFTGAAAVTLTHEVARRLTADAPRLDLIGQRAIRRGLRKAGHKPPHGQRLLRASLAGELAANTAYFTLVGLLGRRHTFGAGSLLGSLAGLGAVVLPRYLGLGSVPTTRTKRTQAMSWLWYVLGGLAAAAIVKYTQRLTSATR